MRYHKFDVVGSILHMYWQKIYLLEIRFSSRLVWFLKTKTNDGIEDILINMKLPLVQGLL
jgi:hypothetical protein